MSDKYKRPLHTGGKPKELAKNFKKLTSIRNRGIDRKKVLSSGRPLPSSYGWQHLDALCQLSHSHLLVAMKELEQKEAKIREQHERLVVSHKRDPDKLKEVPNSYILPQKLQILFARVDAAQEVHNALAKNYKNATGHDWRPKININEPLNEKDNQTATRGFKAPIRPSTKLR